MPELVRFAAPYLLSLVMQNLYAVVDMVIVGQYAGSVGLSAVTISSQAAAIITMLCMGLTEGGQILISQQTGARDDTGRSRTIGTMLCLCALVGAGLTVLGLALYKPVIALMGTPGVAVRQAEQYLGICCGGTLFIIFYNAVSAVLRGMGDSKHPMVIIALASVLNVALDLLFVAVLDMGAAGAALGTVLSQAFSIATAIVILRRCGESLGFAIGRRSLRLHKDVCVRIAKLGVPISLEMSIVNVSFMLLIGMINIYGIDITSAYGVGERISSFLKMPAMALASASGTMIGQNMGAGKTGRVSRLVGITALCVTALSATMILVTSLWPRELFTLFNSENGLLEAGLRYFRIMRWGFLTHGLMTVFSAHSRGCGATSLMMLGGILDGLVFRLGLAWLFSSVLGMCFEGVLIGAVLAPLGGCCITAAYFVFGKWKKTTAE